MATIKGIHFERASYTDPQMPGYVFPCVTMHNPRTGVTKPVPLKPMKCTVADANRAALQLAIQRLREGDHDLGPLPME